MWEERGKLSYGQGNGQARTRGVVQPLGNPGVDIWSQVWAGGHRPATEGLWSGLSPPPNFPGQTQTMRNSKRDDATSISASWNCRSCPHCPPMASCTLLYLLHGSQTQPHHEHCVLWPQALVLWPPPATPTTSSHSTFGSQLKSCWVGIFPRPSGPAAGVVAPPVPPQIPIFSPLLVQITTSCNCLCTHGVLEKRKPLSLISLSPMPGRVPGTWSPQ